MSVSDIFGEIDKRLKADPDKAKNELDAIYKFVVTGDGGGTWIVDCKAVEVRNEDGEGECTITVDAADWVAINNGELDAMQAFMLGKIAIDGDMALAMKLQELM